MTDKTTQDAPAEEETSLQDELRSAYEEQTGENLDELKTRDEAEISEEAVNELRESEGIKAEPENKAAKAAAEQRAKAKPGKSPASDDKTGDEEAKKAEKQAKTTGDEPGEKAFGSDWDEADKALLEQASPELRALVEKQVTAAGKSGEDATFANGIREIFKPWESAMKENGTQPADVIRHWAQLYDMSVRDPKGYILHTLQQLEMKPEDLIEKNPDPATAADYDDDDDDIFADPETKALKKQVAELKAQLAGNGGQGGQTAPQAQAGQPQLTQEQIEQRAVWQDRVQQFRDAKDADGNPVNPHFDALQSEMSIIAEQLRRAGKTIDLKTVYDRAVMLNPEISALVEADKKKAADAAARQEKMAALNKAKRASASIRSDEEATDRPTKIEDMDTRDVIRAAARAHGTL